MRLRRCSVVLAVALSASLVWSTPASSAAVECVSYPDFSSTIGLDIHGNASTTGNSLMLTDDVGGAAGAAYTSAKVSVARGFKTTFIYQMTGNFGTGGADGFAFVINNATQTLIPADPDSSPTGTGLGYDGIHNSVVVEFDTYDSDADPNDNHIAVHTGGKGRVVADGPSIAIAKALDVDLNDGDAHEVTITYKPKKGKKKPKLVVTVDGNKELATSKINLKKRIGLDEGKAWAGFTAATGGVTQRHLIDNWTMSCKV